MPPLNRSFVSQPFTGRITLDMIEEFLNPISVGSSAAASNSSSQKQPGIMTLPSATGGYGLTMYGAEAVEDKDKRLEKKRRQREEAEISYRSMRREFEEELVRAAMNEMSLDENNVIYSIFF